MTMTSRREVARILRAEADGIRRNGFAYPFSHNFNCLQAQVLRADICEGCLLRDFVPEQYRTEAFPCQHLDENGYGRVVADPDLPERVAARLLSIADELEAQAEIEELSRAEQDSQ